MALHISQLLCCPQKAAKQGATDVRLMEGLVKDPRLDLTYSRLGRSTFAEWKFAPSFEALEMPELDTSGLV